MELADPRGLSSAAAADHPAAIAACIALATAGFLTSIGMPFVVSALIGQYGYTEGFAGDIASAEYLGMLAASAVVSTLILGVSRRKLATIGILIAIGSNAASLLASSLPTFLAVRFLSGLGCGIGYGVAVATLAGTTNTVRNFMFFIFGNALTNVLVVYLAPWVLERWHLEGIFVAYCSLFSGIAFCVPFLPQRIPPLKGSIQNPPPSAASSVPAYVPWLCLFAVFSFYMMAGGYWAFVVTLGVSTGFDAEFVGQMLSAAILLSLISCLVAYRLSQRVGQSKPLLFALGIIAIAQFGGAIWFGSMTFLIGLAIVNSFWNFTDIYQFGTIAKIDRSGVFASRIQGAQTLGYTVSPAVAGWFLDHHLGYPRLLALFGTYVAIAFAAYTVVYTVLRRRAPELADAS